MKRKLFLALLLGTGCTYGSYGPPAGDVTFYWSFDRNKLDGTIVAYDTNPNPGGTGSGPCAQSGVTTISIAYPDGTLVDPTSGNIPCVYYDPGYPQYPPVQGATIPALPVGSYTFVLTGYQGNVPVFQGQVAATVVEGTEVRYSVALAGIQDDLDVYALFFNRDGTSQAWTTCAAAGVDSLSFNLVDGANTSVGSGSVSCMDPAGVSFRVAQGKGVDRDTYSIRLQGLRTGVTAPVFDSATTALVPTCSAQTFNHFGSDTGNAAWDVKLYDVTANGTLCQ